MRKNHLFRLGVLIFSCIAIQPLCASPSSDADTMVVVPGNAEHQKVKKQKQKKYRTSFISACVKDGKEVKYCECLANEGAFVISYKLYQQMALKPNGVLESMANEEEGAISSIVLNVKKRCN